jgi:hypothetical protein
MEHGVGNEKVMKTVLLTQPYTHTHTEEDRATMEGM